MSKKVTNASSGIKIADIGYDVLPGKSSPAVINNISDYGAIPALLILVF